MSITEQIMSTLVEAKKGNKEAARKFAIMCAAKDEHTIMKIMNIVLPNTISNSIPYKFPEKDFSKGIQKGEICVMGTIIKL